MSETRLSCWRSPSSAGMLVACALVAIAGDGLGWHRLQTNPLDHLLAGTYPLYSVLGVGAAAMLLAGVGCLLVTVYNRAAGVALELNGSGRTDHRGGSRPLPGGQSGASTRRFTQSTVGFGKQNGSCMSASTGRRCERLR